MNAVNKDLFIPNVEKNAVFDMHKQTQETTCIHHFFLYLQTQQVWMLTADAFPFNAVKISNLLIILVTISSLQYAVI